MNHWNFRFFALFFISVPYNRIIPSQLVHTRIRNREFLQTPRTRCWGEFLHISPKKNQIGREDCNPFLIRLEHITKEAAK